jgi:hypothetical protein
MLNIYYIAGIFDGEGSIGLHKRTVKESSRGYLYYPKIRLGMTGEGTKIVEELKNQFGGHIGWRRYPTKNRDLLTWTITSKFDIQRFLDAVAPYLIVKKKQAFAVMSFYEGGTYQQKDWKSNRMTDEEYLRREMICTQVKLLNKKCKESSTVAETK